MDILFAGLFVMFVCLMISMVIQKFTEKNDEYEYSEKEKEWQTILRHANEFFVVGSTYCEEIFTDKKFIEIFGLIYNYRDSLNLNKVLINWDRFEHSAIQHLKKTCNISHSTETCLTNTSNRIREKIIDLLNRKA